MPEAGALRYAAPESTPPIHIAIRHHHRGKYAIRSAPDPHRLSPHRAGRPRGHGAQRVFYSTENLNDLVHHYGLLVNPENLLLYRKALDLRVLRIGNPTVWDDYFFPRPQMFLRSEPPVAAPLSVCRARRGTLGNKLGGQKHGEAGFAAGKGRISRNRQQRAGEPPKRRSLS